MRACSFAVLLIAVAAGCNRPKPTPASSGPGPTLLDGVQGKTAPTVRPTEAAASDGPAKLAEFAGHLKAQKVPADLLTPEFKKRIAPSAFASDKELGYSEFGLRQYLAELPAAAGTAPATAAISGGYVASVTAVKGAILVKWVNTPAGWRADWVQAVAAPPASPLMLAHFTATAFVEAALAGKPALAASLMTPKLRAEIAPPQDEADKALGYNASFLLFKIDAFHRGVTAATYAPSTGAIAVGQLTGAGGTKRDYKLTLDASGGAVEKFE